jgi:ribonuclease III
MRRRSRRSGRQSTTSRRTSKTNYDDAPPLKRLIESLPPERLEHVFTHSSWAPDRASSYERLEFLGDSVLELAIARELYDRFPDFSEGRMAKLRSHVVSRASCAVVARELALDEELLERAPELPEGEATRLAHNRNVLAALLEAALAAVYLEHGFEAIEQSIVATFRSRIDYALTHHVDYKTELQEALARVGRSVSYSVLEVEGPPHDRTFTAAANVDGVQVGSGQGRSKKDAEQEAAQQALEALVAEGAARIVEGG